MLTGGVVHLKKCLSEDEQLRLLTGASFECFTSNSPDIESCTAFYSPTQARNSKSNFTKIIALNLNKDKARTPKSFQELSAREVKNASELDSTIPVAYDADYCTSFVYGLDGKLTGHCDKVL